MIRTLMCLAALSMLGLAACTARAPLPPGTVIAEGSNKAFSHAVTTTAPPAAVWALWSDPKTWKLWDTGLRDAALSGPFEVGGRGTITPHSGGDAAFEITAITPGVSYTFETELPGARLVITRTIVSADPTTFRHDVAFEGAAAGLMASQLGAGFRADLPVAMDKLARLAEAAPAP